MHSKNGQVTSFLHEKKINFNNRVTEQPCLKIITTDISNLFSVPRQMATDKQMELGN